MIKKSHSILLVIALLLTTLGAAAQDNDHPMLSYNQAEEEYNIGHFEAADSILHANMSTYTGTLRASAYRLLSLCSLFMGDNEGATQNVQLMFKENPYYTTTLNDPIRFVDLVESLKNGGARVSTASQQAETLDEVPVPVTLITEDMIRASGARNIQDLLLLYVPGMSLIDGVDANIAMHGVYSTTQEKILVMLDGHRLNSRATNSESLDFRTSLDKIKQIEVLRGPASSLYGNVALTAVVNIITKKGHDMDGIKLSAGIGSFKTYRADLTMGKAGVGNSYSLWASVYNSRGEKRTISPGDPDFYGEIEVPGSMYIGGYNHTPSYDIGFNGEYNNFTAMVSLQNSKKVTQYAPLSPSLYKYDLYRYNNDIKPGRERKTLHMNLGYDNNIGRVGLKVNVFFDMEKQKIYNILSDTISDVLGSNIGALTALELSDTLIEHVVGNRDLVHKAIAQIANLWNGENVQGFIATPAFQNFLADEDVQAMLKKYGIDPSNFDIAAFLNNYMQNNKESVYKTMKTALVNLMLVPHGIYDIQTFKDYTIGGSLQLTYPFKSGRFTGNVLGGVQYEKYILQNSSFTLGDDYTHVLFTLSDESSILTNGRETMVSPFVQLKTAYDNRLILNCGIRYDHKKRFNDKNLNAISPRASLIYKLNNAMNLKLGYAHSFVDAPYYYRANKLGTYKGNTDLEAETMDAIQLDFLWNIPRHGLSLEANAYFNSLSNLVYYDYAYSSFSNAGKMRILGIEGSLSYVTTHSLATLNCSYQGVLSSESAAATGSKIYNVPNFMATALYRYRVLDNKNYGRLFARANATCYAKQIAGYSSRLLDYSGAEPTTIETDIPARVILNAGIDYTFNPVTLSIDCYNLLGTHYRQGASGYVPMPQQGRSFMARISCKF